MQDKDIQALKALAELSACPICGCNAEYDYGAAMTSGQRIVKARCKFGCVQQTIFHCNEDDAAKAWNNRAPQRPAVDLSGLTRYEFSEVYGHLGTVQEAADGEYVKLSDVQALLSTANAAEPVAWIVYALYDGKMIPQYPAMASEADAEAHAAMYTADSKAEVRPLFSTANAAQAGVREQALEEAANVVASTNTLGMTAPAAITRLCAAIRTLKSTPSPSVNSKEGGK